MASIKLQRNVNNISRDKLGLSEGTTNKHIYIYVCVCVCVCVCRGTELNKQTNNTLMVCAAGHSVGNVNHYKRKFIHENSDQLVNLHLSRRCKQHFSTKHAIKSYLPIRCRKDTKVSHSCCCPLCCISAVCSLLLSLYKA